MNNAKVNNPKAKPLLLNSILDNAISVIGIVILKNSMASIPNILLLNANINKIAETSNESNDILIKPILSPIIPPSIFPKTTAKVEIKASINLLFHSKARINPT